MRRFEVLYPATRINTIFARLQKWKDLRRNLNRNITAVKQCSQWGGVHDRTHAGWSIFVLTLGISHFELHCLQTIQEEGDLPRLWQKLGVWGMRWHSRKWTGERRNGMRITFTHSYSVKYFDIPELTGVINHSFNLFMPNLNKVLRRVNKF